MTVVATDGKTLAADSLTTASREIRNYAPKVHSAADGSVFAAEGPVVSGQKFRRYMQQGGDWPELSEEFAALILTADGKAWWIDKQNERCEMRLPAQIGSGGEYAMGAMMAGASPAEACSIAIRCSTTCGGDITVMAPAARGLGAIA